VVSHFRNLENTQKKIVTHRLHHEEMRIFKVRKRSEKSRRYVITRIYGFLFSQKYALLFNAGSEGTISDAFFVAVF